MERAEALARERGCAYLRLDVHGGHTGLARFYQGLGYEPRGTVAVRSPDEPGLLCLEKWLAG